MTSRSIAACAVLLPVLGLLLSNDLPPRQNLDPDLEMSVHAVDTELGCRITVKALNGDARTDVWFWSENSRVRTRQGLVKFWGPWKKPLPMSNRRIRPGELATMTMELDLGCDYSRQYEFHLWKGTKTNAVTRCYGGDKGTTRREIPLSDVNRLFSTSSSIGC